MRLFLILAMPAVAIINVISNAIVRVFGVRAGDLSDDRVHTETELKFLLAASEMGGILDPVEQDLASNSLELGDITLGDIMVPRMRVIGIADNCDLADAREVAIRSGHDWLPVFRGGSTDDICGVIDWHSLFRAVDGSAWLPLVTAVQFLPKSAPATYALSKLRSAGSEMAVVLDEFGGTAGLVTVRTLYDEVTREESILDGPTEIAGRLPVRFVEEMVGANLPAGATTIGGLVTASLGRFARVGDTVALGDWTATVLRVVARRGTVEAVRLERTALVRLTRAAKSRTSAPSTGTRKTTPAYVAKCLRTRTWK